MAAPLRIRALLVKLTVIPTKIVLLDSNVSREQGEVYLEYSVSKRSLLLMISATILIIAGRFRQSN